MSVTITWSFETSGEGWTFSDESTGSSSASGVWNAAAEAWRLSMLPITSGNAWGTIYLEGLSLLVAIGDTVELDYSAPSDPFASSVNLIVTYADTSIYTAIGDVTTAGTRTLTITAAGTIERIQVRFGRSSARPGLYTQDAEEIRVTTAASPFAGGSKPLGMSIELLNGENIWTTLWQSGNLTLRRYSSNLSVQNSYSIAAATIAEVEARTYFIFPYCPPFFGTASLDNIVYMYGRWDDGAVKHLAKSTDAGASFSNIGDSATWTTGWVGGFFADDANTLYALVNGASRALYRSLNGGTTWGSLSSLPFDVDPGGVSKHPDGRILISNRDAGGQTAAYAIGPNYSSWIDATGSPSFPSSTPGNGSNAIIWIT